MKKIFFLIIITGYSGILFSQNVGIGTITPLEKLSVLTNYGYGISHEANSIKLSSYIDASGAFMGTISNHPFHFYTNNGAAQMTLLQNGNVGIGTYTPLSKLHILTESAGGVTPNIESGFTLEHNNHMYINFLTPNTKESGILFGLNSNSAHGGIIYNNPLASGGLLFRTNGNVNRMVIDQNGNVGIGTTNPGAKLEVNGTFKLTDGTQNAGKVLVTDAAGNASWNNSIGFAAIRTSPSITIMNNSTVDVVCNTEEYDQAPSSAYNPSTGFYTAPQNGLYHFNAGAVVFTGIAGPEIILQFQKNTTYLRSASTSATNINPVSIIISFDVQLTQGDVVKFSIYNNSGVNVSLANGVVVYVTGTFFNGHFIR